MDDRLEEIMNQYDFKVNQVARIRGALCIDTDQGIRLLKAEDGTKRRIAFEDQVTRFLTEQGYENADIIIPNKEGYLTTENSYGDRYIVKKWFYGTECGVRVREELFAGMENLARIHRILEKGKELGKVRPVSKPEEETEMENYFFLEQKPCESAAENCSEKIMDENSKEDKKFESEQEDTLLDSLERHGKELKRVGTYIRSKKQKSEMERAILQSVDYFFERAEEGCSLLAAKQLSKIEDEEKKQGKILHGNYNYHNILIMDHQVACVHFEKAQYGLQILDLYHFFRKVMEKNGWKVSLGDRLLKEYAKYGDLGQEKFEILGALLFYPEKYWKIINHYYNSRKSWVPKKDLDKLSNVCEQERQKEDFLHQVFGLR